MLSVIENILLEPEDQSRINTGDLWIGNLLKNNCVNDPSFTFGPSNRIDLLCFGV